MTVKPMPYDVIETLHPLVDGNVPTGSQGTIVHQHADGVFEVEFTDDNGQTIALETISREQFVIVWRAEVAENVPITAQLAQVTATLPQQSRIEVLDFAHFLSSRQHKQHMVAA